MITCEILVKNSKNNGTIRRIINLNKLSTQPNSGLKIRKSTNWNGLVSPLTWTQLKICVYTHKLSTSNDPKIYHEKCSKMLVEEYSKLMDIHRKQPQTIVSNKVYFTKN